MASFRVICVRQGPKYGDEWVHRLRGMVDANLTEPHEFVCMTDRLIKGVRCVPCAPGLTGWWAKLGLGWPGLFPGMNLYLDLDVVIDGNIDDLIWDSLWPGKLCAPDDFSYSLAHPKPGLGAEQQRLLGGPGTINSSVMVWNGDDIAPILTEFRREKMDEVHGDQNWITQCLWPDRLELMDPRWVCSYKYHVERNERSAPIIVFHGEPKPNSLPRNHRLRQQWESAA